MLSEMTLGQYFPGDSIIHKLDPRFKIICIILYIVALFCADSYAAFAAIAASTMAIVLLSRLGIMTILKSVKPVMFILAFTIIANLLWTTGEKPLLEFWIIKIYPEGIRYALLMAVRIICLIISTFVLLTYTTAPVALTDAIERLLSPFKKIGLPVHEFSMMMTIALRFIPTLIEETGKIMNAQKARGADFESGNLLKRAKALVPILIPLFVSAFRRADELAGAMECRLYHGGDGRTRMKIMKAKPGDFVMLLLFILFCGAIIATRFFAKDII
ncbi:MAG: energy-coupling factor transporter transmembrane protein EcfT [Ruminococcaceae bacterium]|nr:energy-coupling factor transporter transmembrane protein EcfT [Oscillospiraceae bacterium]